MKNSTRLILPLLILSLSYVFIIGTGNSQYYDPTFIKMNIDLTAEIVISPTVNAMDKSHGTINHRALIQGSVKISGLKSGINILKNEQRVST
jgi:hypothetical protein